jgi:hypothetical protein
VVVPPIFPGESCGSLENINERSIAMPVDQKIRDSLRLGDLKSKLPPNPRVVDIRVEDYVDTDGEDALRVTVVLDEDVEVEKLRAEETTRLKTLIHDLLRDQEVELWPYIQFAKQSDLDQLDDEEDEA